MGHIARVRKLATRYYAKSVMKSLASDIGDDEISEKKTAHMTNTTKTTVFHSMLMKTAQQDKRTIQKTGLNFFKKSTKEADEHFLRCNITNWVETQKKLKWRQALRIATQSPDRWTRKAAEWNPGLIISTKTERRAVRPAKRWEDDLNAFERFLVQSGSVYEPVSIIQNSPFSIFWVRSAVPTFHSSQFPRSPLTDSFFF